MRLATVLALAALTAAPALAQTQYADSTGGYVSLRSLSFTGARLDAVDGSAGYRFANGADVGLRYAHTDGFNSDYLRIGPIAGATRALGAGFDGRVEASVQYATAGGISGNYLDSNDEVVPLFEYRTRALYEDLSATVSRRVPLVGSLALRPAVGGYVAAYQQLTFDYPPATFEPPRTAVSAGVQYELPFTFRLFGQDAAVVPGGRFSLKGNPLGRDATYVGGGFRLNF